MRRREIATYSPARYGDTVERAIIAHVAKWRDAVGARRADRNTSGRRNA